MLSAIDAVDWEAVPGHPDWYDPARAAQGLRMLAGASNLVQAAQAGSLLGGGGIVHGHSAAVFPAAVAAAPLLLDIVQQGHPAARETALGLVDEALSSYPHAHYTRVTTSYGTGIPICCAVAHHVRARRELLASLGKRGRALLDDAAEHWRFEIRECVADGRDTAAFGILESCFPDGVQAVERNVDGELVVLDEVALEYPPTDGVLDACLRVRGRPPRDVPSGAVLYSAECGERVH
ncbi:MULTISPECIES: hypothetical protein [unclassified Streptomyces]|uniref:hypothetical protein n=1 Tax=unclassified Streptomyces TaxID=2593676 RepID=UPI001F2352F5|nr:MULTISPECIES: hypothetical protein [unclassified Streptomyces]